MDSDLTFEIKSFLTLKLNGFAEFGTLTAIMGPSGSSLTSLLMCLCGTNDSKLSEETKIRLNKWTKIVSTLI